MNDTWTEIVSDLRLTPDARVLALHILSLGPGEHEVSFRRWRALLNNASRERVRRALALLVEFGYATPSVLADEDLYGSRPAIPKAVRDDVLADDACAACGGSDRLQVDHIVPWSRGGTHDRENLRVLCLSCNESKGSKLDSEWSGP